MNEPTQTRTTILGGTLLVFLSNINSDDILKTILLTAIGAVVSFGMSQLLKMVVKWWKSPKG